MKKNELDPVSQLVLDELLRGQKDELIKQFNAEKDWILSENQRLNMDIAKLTRTIMADNAYIQYLLNSFWWKVSLPLRMVTRYLKKFRKLPYEFVQRGMLEDKIDKIDDIVSVVIFTSNAGEEFTMQLRNLKKQKGIPELQIIVVDRNSSDNTVKYAKDAGAEIVAEGTDEAMCNDLYERLQAKIKGKYIVTLDQDKIIDSKYWIYQAIRPIRDGQANAALFTDDSIIDEIRNAAFYSEMKQRISEIAGNSVLFLPNNRNLISFIVPTILDKTTVVAQGRKVSWLID